MRKQTRTAFYVETLLLIGALVAVVLILAQCFSVAEQTRLQAEELTNAVHLARNAAEAAAGAETHEELAHFLSQDAMVNPEESGFRICYDKAFQGELSDPLVLTISWDRKPQPGCGLVNYTIIVESTVWNREIYRLETAIYLGGEAS